MKKMSFRVPLYYVDITLVQIESKDDWEELSIIFKENNCNEAAQIEELVKSGYLNGGHTYSNLEKGIMIVVFHSCTSTKIRENIYSHEKRHVEDRILNYFEVDDIESAALLAGYLGEQFQIFSSVCSNKWKPSDSDISLLERVISGKADPKDFQSTLTGILGNLKKL